MLSARSTTGPTGWARARWGSWGGRARAGRPTGQVTLGRGGRAGAGGRAGLGGGQAGWAYPHAKAGCLLLLQTFR